MLRFSLASAVVAGLLIIMPSRSNAALIYYTAGLPSTVSAGSPLLFGNIAYPFNGSYSLGSSSGISFGITPIPNGLFSDDNNGIQWAAGPGIGGTALLNNGNILKFANGSSISAGSASNWTVFDPGFAEDGQAGNWNAGGSGFAGLRYNAGSGNYFYGWVEMNYNAAADTVTVSRFAFQDVANIAAPTSTPIPEPSQVAASLLLLGGIGGYVFLKRRKSAKAAVAIG